MKLSPSILKPAAVVGLLASLSACSDSSGPETASVRILLTDAASDYIEEAMVDIGPVEILDAGNDEWIQLAEDGTDGLVNLLDLRDGATLALANEQVTAGTYGQVRMIVEDATVTLKAPYQFNGGGDTQTLTVPSGAQTGIKLNLSGSDGEGESGPLEIVPGEMVLVVDFDVSQSYVIQGNPDTPAGINGVHFRPTLRVVVSDVAGSISGTVSTGEAGVDVEGLTVTAEPTDDGVLETYQTQTGTGTVAADGSYTIHFLVPGSYDVSVEGPDGFVGDPATTPVDVDLSEDEVGVDFEIVAATP